MCCVGSSSPDNGTAVGDACQAQMRALHSRAPIPILLPCMLRELPEGETALSSAAAVCPSQANDGCMHTMRGVVAHGPCICPLDELRGMHQKHAASRSSRRKLRRWSSSTQSNAAAPAQSFGRHAMLCAALKCSGPAAAYEALPTHGAMARSLRRAARKYSVQLSKKVLEASGLWPLDVLHQVCLPLHAPCCVLCTVPGDGPSLACDTTVNLLHRIYSSWSTAPKPVLH